MFVYITVYFIIALSRLPMYFVLLLFPTYHYTGVILFAIGIFLDIFDGIVARKMKQSKEYTYKPVEDLP